MKPIGGYFELERGNFTPRHNGVYVNTGSNALRLIVRTLKISHIHAPAYTCPVVHKTLQSEGCSVELYDLDAKFMPARTFPKNDFILANDYFGLTGGNIAQLATEYPNLIVDNAQSYFADPLGRATFYSPRKFMGLPDGGIAVFNRDDISTLPDLPLDISYGRMTHLLKRHDLGATEAYADFQKTDASLFDLPLRAMSNLTHALMSAIDETHIRSQRLANFSYLFNRLKTNFPINPLPESAPLVFPFTTNNPTLRQHLIAAKIFAANYWPDAPFPFTQFTGANLIALPLDQRYDESNMDHVLKVINS